MTGEGVQLLQTTGGGVGGLPPSLASLLHSQACHGNHTAICVNRCEVHALQEPLNLEMDCS